MTERVVEAEVLEALFRGFASDPAVTEALGWALIQSAEDDAAIDAELGRLELERGGGLSPDDRAETVGSVVLEGLAENDDRPYPALTVAALRLVAGDLSTSR